MGDLSDRFFILLLAFVGFGGFFIAIVGGWVMADLEGTMQYAVIGGLGVLVLGILIGIWLEFNKIDRESA